MTVFRIRHEKRGGHIHMRLFSAKRPNMTYAKLGDLCCAEVGGMRRHCTQRRWQGRWDVSDLQRELDQANDDFLALECQLAEARARVAAMEKVVSLVAENYKGFKLAELAKLRDEVLYANGLDPFDREIAGALLSLAALPLPPKEDTP